MTSSAAGPDPGELDSGPGRAQTHRKPATVTGGGIGTLIVLYAQGLPRPWNLYVAGSAPAVSALVTAWWPRALDALGIALKEGSKAWKRWRAKRILRHLIKGWESDYKAHKSGSRNKDAEELHAEIIKARRALVDLDKQKLRDVIIWIESS